LPIAAAKLRTANKILQKKFPEYTITIYDAARPVAVQRQLWDLAKIEPSKKHLYLSHPEQNSLHNYGAAVDVAILDSRGQMLDFGSPYDFFGEAAQPQLEQKLLQQGDLNLWQIANRKLLRSVMMQAGFTPIKTEWWHFNACTRAFAKQHYKLFQ
jgi:D-alanyl-D-alanine dipeptidase